MRCLVLERRFVEPEKQSGCDLTKDDFDEKEIQRHATTSSRWLRWMFSRCMTLSNTIACTAILDLQRSSLTGSLATTGKAAQLQNFGMLIAIMFPTSKKIRSVIIKYALCGEKYSVPIRSNSVLLYFQNVPTQRCIGILRTIRANQRIYHTFSTVFGHRCLTV